MKRLAICGVVLSGAAALSGAAQTCTTQAKMQAATRQSMADSALKLAAAVKAGDGKTMKADTVAAYANDFAAAEYAVQNTADKLGGDTLQVTDVFLLDASALKAGSEADFTCALTGSASEVDFSITGLDAGVYGFAMVEASGSRPWLLSFLLRQDGGSWRMAGFYPHARTMGGKDGLRYWTDARAQVGAKQPWLAWLEYGQAEALLSPANFFSSTNLDKLRSERRQNAPPAVEGGISVEQPLIVRAADGQEYRFSAVTVEATENGLGVRLVLHFMPSAAGGRAQDIAAASALLAAHPELRQAYAAVLVFGDVPNQNPSVFSGAMTDVPR
jgi:hypothetical protein